MRHHLVSRFANGYLSRTVYDFKKEMIALFVPCVRETVIRSILMVIAKHTGSERYPGNKYSSLEVIKDYVFTYLFVNTYVFYMRS